MGNGQSLLGNNCENDVHSPYDVGTGEVIPPYNTNLKWMMQAASRKAMACDVQHRIHSCHRNRRPGKETVGVRRSEASGKTYFDGVITCGSVWVCPVCAMKIQAVRVNEVAFAIDAHTSVGGSVSMATLTVRHTIWDNLEDTLDGFGKALGHFRAGSKWQGLKRRYGIIGTVTGYEVTYSNNGWHPHAHILLFTKGSVDLERFQSELQELWERRARIYSQSWAGAKALTLQDASKAHTYLNKYAWAAQDELVRSHTKHGRGDSLTPFDLLRLSIEDPTKSAHYLSLFREFASAFFNKRQLVWSRGFKKVLLGTEGPKDEEIAVSVGENDPLLASIGFDDWRLIKRHNLHGYVLAIVKEFGPEGLEYLMDPYRKTLSATPFVMQKSLDQRRRGGSRKAGSVGSPPSDPRPLTTPPGAFGQEQIPAG